MPPTTTRPSGVDRLTIEGTGRTGSGFRLHWSSPDGRSLSVHPGPENHFSRVADAKAAAARLAASPMPVSSPTLDAFLRDLDDSARWKMQGAVIDALTGTTWGEREQARLDREYAADGGPQRDTLHELARNVGHEPGGWRRHGARSWRSSCLSCHETFQVTYQSMSRSYRYPALPATCPSPAPTPED